MSQSYPSSITTLPNELLFEIFSHLNHKSLLNIASVCTRFRDISRQLVNMKFRFTFTESGAYDGPIELALGTSCPNTVEFKLVGNGERWETFDDWITSSQYSFRLLEDLPNLHRLKYVIHDSYCSVDRHFCLKKLPALETEELFIFHTYGSFCPRCLDNFLASFIGLKHLNLFYQNVGDVEVEIICRNLRNLTNLSISGCLGVTRLNELSKLKLLQKLSLFKVKNVSSLDFCLPDLLELEMSRVEKIDEIGLGCLVKGCPKLRSFYVFDCTSFNDDCIEILLKGLRNLQHLRIEGCKNFTVKCRKMIRMLCPKPLIGIYLGEDEL